jgi:hypothetical protein
MASRPSDPPDLEALARRFLDLWQDQVAALAENTDLTEQWSRLLAALGTPAENPDGDGLGESGFAPRSAAATAPSGAGGGDMARLAERVAALERRLARLEGKRRMGKPRGKPARRPKRPRA